MRKHQLSSSDKPANSHQGVGGGERICVCLCWGGGGGGGGGGGVEGGVGSGGLVQRNKGFFCFKVYQQLITARCK